MINENWTRWVFASISKTLSDAAQSKGYRIRFENENAPITPQGTWAEVRVTGPSAKEESKGRWRLDYLINILVNQLKDDADNHAIFRLCGKVESSLPQCITVKMYGDTADDHPTVVLDYLMLVPNGDKDIETTHFGQIADERVLQSTVEASYRITLDA